MSPATAPREAALDERLLHVDPKADRFADRRVRDLPSLLRAGDLLIVNDAATIPASLHAEGGALEIRLVAAREDGAWDALLFGPGDWRMRTEDRPPPPALAAGAIITVADDLHARVEAVSPRSSRLVTLRFDATGAALWTALYAHGRPIQYSYLTRSLVLWDVQTAYATRPWAVELPSAGRPLRPGLLVSLLRAGVEIATLTHAAGLSSTGDPALDALLPLPERYEIPAATIAAIANTRGRVVAVGTTVVRALEGCAASHGGELVAGAGVTDLVIGAGFRPRVVDGIYTGMHEPGTSHYALLQAFAPRAVLDRAHAFAEEHGYVGHEFGDSNLVLAA